jgi:ribokinase
VLVDDRTGENQIAVSPGANALVSVEHVESVLRALELGRGDVVVFSFELPLPPLRFAGDLARRVGARLIVNPAPAQPGFADVLPGALVTPNAAELASLAPGTDAREAALALAARTGQPVLVTLGAGGAMLADSGKVTRFPAHEVTARDTTGAGDTVTGVLAASLAQGHDLPAAVRRSVAAAAQIDRLLAGTGADAG